MRKPGAISLSVTPRLRVSLNHKEMAMKMTNPEAKDQLLRRLRRVEGQVRGVQEMITEERDCREILQQLTAVQSAVRAASLVFIEEYATRCLMGDSVNDPTRRAELLKDLIGMLGKAP